MPDFRPSYEWQQAAQRNRELIDPVITVRRLTRFDLGRRVGGRTDCALVFATAKGGYDSFLPPHRPNRAELAGRRYRAVYEVDMGIHHLALTQSLPAAGDAFSFEAEVAVSWRVSAAERVVGSGVRDVPALITPRIRQLMRLASRHFPVERSAEAEQAVQAAVTAGPIADAEGLQVTCTVQLGLDAATRAHQDLLRSIQHDHVAADPLHRLAMLRADQEEEINTQKARFYRYHLEQGGVAAWALQVARHPADLPNALQHLTAEQQQLVGSQVQLVEKLLEDDRFEEFQLEEPTRLALQAFTNILRQTAGITTVAGSVYSGPGPGQDHQPAPLPSKPPKQPSVPLGRSHLHH